MSSQSLRASRHLGRFSAAPLGGRLVGRAGWRIQAAGEEPGSTSSDGPARGPPSAAAGAGRRSEGYTGQELSGSCMQPWSFSDCPKEGGSGSAAAVAACFAEAGLEVWEAASIMDRNAKFAALQPWQLADKLGIVKEVLQGEAVGARYSHQGSGWPLFEICLRSPLFAKTPFHARLPLQVWKPAKRWSWPTCAKRRRVQHWQGPATLSSCAPASSSSSLPATCARRTPKPRHRSCAGGL